MSKDWLSNSYTYTPDIDAYLKRIRYIGSREVNAKTLFQLQWHHVQAIPYEVLDTHLTGKVDLAPEVVERKIVVNGRGGYCYEQNTLFMHVLKTLGFKVKAVTARARWQKPEEFMSGNIHLILIVDVDGRSYACDVGFSSCGSAYPLLFDSEAIQHMPLESRRVIWRDELYVHQLLAKGVWLDVYVFTLHESFPMDWEIGSYYWQSHPNALGVKMIIVSIAAKDCRYRLLDKEFTKRYTDGTVENRTIETEKEYIHILRTVFNLNIPDGVSICPPNTTWTKLQV